MAIAANVKAINEHLAKKINFYESYPKTIRIIAFATPIVGLKWYIRFGGKLANFFGVIDDEDIQDLDPKSSVLQQLHGDLKSINNIMDSRIEAKSLYFPVQFYSGTDKDRVVEPLSDAHSYPWFWKRWPNPVHDDSFHIYNVSQGGTYDEPRYPSHVVALTAFGQLPYKPRLETLFRNDIKSNDWDDCRREKLISGLQTYIDNGGNYLAILDVVSQMIFSDHPRDWEIDNKFLSTMTDIVRQVSRNPPDKQSAITFLDKLAQLLQNIRPLAGSDTTKIGHNRADTIQLLLTMMDETRKAAVELIKQDRSLEASLMGRTLPQFNIEMLAAIASFMDSQYAPVTITAQKMLSEAIREADDDGYLDFAINEVIKYYERRPGLGKGEKIQIALLIADGVRKGGAARSAAIAGLLRTVYFNGREQSLWESLRQYQLINDIVEYLKAAAPLSDNEMIFLAQVAGRMGPEGNNVQLASAAYSVLASAPLTASTRGAVLKAAEACQYPAMKKNLNRLISQ